VRRRLVYAAYQKFRFVPFFRERAYVFGITRENDGAGISRRRGDDERVYRFLG
jgi:hypothetical protein